MLTDPVGQELNRILINWFCPGLPAKPITALPRLNPVKGQFRQPRNAHFQIFGKLIIYLAFVKSGTKAAVKEGPIAARNGTVNLTIQFYYIPNNR